MIADPRPADTIVRIFRTYPLLRYPKRSIIIHADSEPAGIFFVEAGFTRMYSLTAAGQEITWNIFAPGSYFPMLWALGGIKNSFYFDAFSPIRVRKAPKDEILTYLRKDAAEFESMVRRIFRGVNGLLLSSDKLLLGSAENRIKEALTLLAGRFGTTSPEGGVRIGIPLTHQDIANLCGLSRETVSVCMKQLKILGWVSCCRKMITLNNQPEKKANLSEIPVRTPIREAHHIFSVR